MEVSIDNLTRYDVARLLNKLKTVIIPVGSHEQHGLHLPLEHDTASVCFIARTAAQKLYPRVLVTPPIAFGLSPHHLPWPLTITLDGKTFIDIVVQVCKSIRNYGINNVVILNGHGGNYNPNFLERSDMGPLAFAVIKARELGSRVTSASYWDLIPPQICKEILDVAEGLGHSGEFETSIGLYIYPKKVKMKRAVLVEGVSKGAEAATWIKGKRLVEEAVKGVITYIEDFIEGKIDDVHYIPYSAERMV